MVVLNVQFTRIQTVDTHCCKNILQFHLSGLYKTFVLHLVITRLLLVHFMLSLLNTLRPRQNGSHFADAIFKCTFLNENVWIPIKISLKFVPQGPINNIPALIQIMAWRRPGDKPLSGPMMVRLPMHICVTRPQWVNCKISTDNEVMMLFNVS